MYLCGMENVATEIKNDLLLKAAIGEKTERPPVWLMRQAGRILPEYREVRGKLSGFKELVETPERASEVTIQPVDILGVDAAIIFSDILVIPEAMGLEYQMVEKKGPWFPETVKTKADVEKLNIADAGGIQYTLDAISITKKALNGDIPLIGFAGAPWTIFSYMIEGQGSKTFSEARKMLYTQPELSHALLEKIALGTINYLKGQIAAGADIVQIFDSWAGILHPDQYAEFAVPYIKMICDAIDEVPKIVFAKGAFFAIEDLAALNCQVIGADWNMNLADIRSRIGSKTVQGNFDPCALYCGEEELVQKTNQMLSTFENGRHIANLGHGLYPDTDWKKVKLFIDTVKSFKY